MSDDLTLVIDNREARVRMDSRALRIARPDSPPEHVPLGLLGLVVVHGSPLVGCNVWRELAERNIPAVVQPARGAGALGPGCCGIGAAHRSTSCRRRRCGARHRPPARGRRDRGTGAGSEPAAERLFHHDSYAYRPRRNVEMALTRVREHIACGLHWLVDAGIRSFFDSIPIKPLRQRLKSFVADRALMALIDQWLDLGTSQASFFSAPRGIAQGAILSPLFCNLYLHDFDEAMHREKVPFVRYADDFLLFAANETDARRALDYAKKVLQGLDLEPHPDKTRITESGPQVIFLGEQLPRFRPARPKAKG